MAVFGLLATPGGLAGQAAEPAEGDTAGPARYFTTFVVASEVPRDVHDPRADLGVGIGRSYPLGGDRRWTLRGEWTAGMATGFRFFDGLFTTAHAGVGRDLFILPLALADDREIPVYLYLGGGGFARWEREHVGPERMTGGGPLAAVALGFRTENRQGGFASFELLHEQHFGDSRSKLFLRFRFLSPRPRRRFRRGGSGA